MANYFNVFAGILTFLGSSSLVYGLWQPTLDFLAIFPSVLYVMVGTMWVTMCFVGVVYMPFIMMVSDDRGG